MGLFDILKKRKEAKKKNELELFINKATVAAIKLAEALDENFDFSDVSITALEKILDDFSKDIPVSKPTEDQIGNMAVLFGTYLGETLLKKGLAQKGYYWDYIEHSPIPVLKHKNGNILTPIDRVYKRLVNGEEDNVVSFYQFALKHL